VLRELVAQTRSLEEAFFELTEQTPTAQVAEQSATAQLTEEGA
jgi:hypothetical protein